MPSLATPLFALLALTAALAFAGCALGVVDCATGKPVGLLAALGGALVAFLEATPAATDA
ncbi:MAG: hypothetical protein GEU80_16445 [Dehalococcoidia bacterium]|nr:hypothetical protein [Dehalococcoidia bacterium]